MSQPEIIRGRTHFGGGCGKIAIILMAGLICLASAVLPAQTTISTGSIQGTVIDASNAVVAGAKVEIVNLGTGAKVQVITSSAGAYASGSLAPGDYNVRVMVKGFKTAELKVTVQVNVTASGSIRLTVGEGTQVVEVKAGDIVVNTEQATVQGVLTADQIETLPINGRNFLDLAQLEPGVQIQDGGTFDPTKNGFSSVSFGGRFGRTARIEVDGVDISDETVGTTTANIPLGAIQESALQQSSLDLSTELTSSGSVNITTKSGTNKLHGDGFYDFRDQRLNAALPGGTKNPFQRNQYGGSIGGPIIPNKLFFFADVERTKQDLLDPVLPSGDFTSIVGSFQSPFRELQGVGKIDWQVGRYKVFYRFAYDQNRSVLPYIPNSFQPFSNNNHARNHVIGIDFNTGNYTHSIRLGYTKFVNGIADAVAGSTIYNPAPGIELAIGSDPNCLTAGADTFCSGPNYLAPQATLQSDRQFKYDGSTVRGKHILRYGFGYNRLVGGGFAEFLGLGPAVGSNNLTQGNSLPCAVSGNCPFPSLDKNSTDFASNPLNYPVQNVTLGNGQGFSSELKSFGYPAGGLGPDNRVSAYFGDAWKLKPGLTITLGLRYVRDTARTDSDLGSVPDLYQFDNQYFRNLGNKVRQPNLNFAPQVGLAWDPSGKGKTVFRAGIGLFYENSVWNNNLFDRPARLKQGLFLGFEPACSGGTAQALTFTTTVDLNTVCGSPVGTAVSQLVQVQHDYQAATVAAGPQQNLSYIGTALADGTNITGTNLYAPNYITPRSVQMNFGLQHEFRPGTVLTVDYLRNVATHTLLSVDTNRVGDANYFNLNNAVKAIAMVEGYCAASNVPGTYSNVCPTDPANGTNDNGTYGTQANPLRVATIADYAANGLDSGYSLCGGGPCPTGSTQAAFPGINPALGANQMLFPIGRSVYNGLQMSLRQQIAHPFRHVVSLNMQISYAFSKYVSSARDNDFINYAQDNVNPNKYIGPNGLDRRHQFSLGGTMELPWNFRMTAISHIDSPLPSNITVPVSGTAGGIFISDLTGDGTGDGSSASNGGNGDLLPGTNIGSFGRSVNISKLNTLIESFNKNFVGQATPAGNVLIQNGLVTLHDLQALGGVIGGDGLGHINTILAPPPGAIGQQWLRTFDLGMSWAYKFHEQFELRPGVTIFNVLNLANFDGPAAPFNTVLDGNPGSVNGTTGGNIPAGLRLGLGSGVNAQGAPRAIEFSLNLKF